MPMNLKPKLSEKRRRVTISKACPDKKWDTSSACNWGRTIADPLH